MHQTKPNSLHFSIISVNKVQILCLINSSQPYLCTSPTNTWCELGVISVQRFSRTKLNMDALSHHILKYAFFSDLGVPGFIFSRDCSAFTKAQCAWLSTHQDIELKNTNVCCLHSTTEYGGKVLFEISHFYLFNIDAIFRVPSCLSSIKPPAC